MDEAPDNLVALRDARQRAEALVAQRYGEDLIDADQLDRRMELIANARVMAQLEHAIADLVDPGTTPANALVSISTPTSHALALRPSVALARPDQVPAERSLTCIFSALEGLGAGPLAHRTKLTCVFGSAEIDLRDNEFGPGATQLDLQVLFGAVEIRIPQGLPVIVDASVMLASIERQGTIPNAPRTPDEPHLRITGFIFAGSIEIEERLTGESRREARRRRRRERKRAKSEQKALKRG